MTASPTLAPDDPALAALRQLDALLRAAMGSDALLLPPAEPLPDTPPGLPTVATIIPVPGIPAPMDDAARIIAAMRDAVFCYGPPAAEPPGPAPGADGFWALSGSVPAPPDLPEAEPEAEPVVAESVAGLIEGVVEEDGTIAFTDPATGATARILLAPPVPDALW